jgi:hypothetical protein
MSKYIEPDWQDAKNVIDEMLNLRYEFENAISGCGDRELLDAATELNEVIAKAKQALKNAKRRNDYRSSL